MVKVAMRMGSPRRPIYVVARVIFACTKCCFAPTSHEGVDLLQSKMHPLEQSAHTRAKPPWSREEPGAQGPSLPAHENSAGWGNSLCTPCKDLPLRRRENRSDVLLRKMCTQTQFFDCSQAMRAESLIRRDGLTDAMQLQHIHSHSNGAMSQPRSSVSGLLLTPAIHRDPHNLRRRAIVIRM